MLHRPSFSFQRHAGHATTLLNPVRASRTRSAVRIAGVAASLVAMLTASPARADDPVIGLIMASATLTNDCQVSAAPLQFGTVSGIASSSNAQSNILVNCTQGTSYTIGLNQGMGAASNTDARYLMGTNPSYALNYKITHDSAFTQNWGNTVGTDTYAGLGNGSQQSIPVYSQVTNPSGNPVASYSDTVTVSINY